MAGVVHGADPDIGARFLLQGHLGIKPLAEQLAGEVDASRPRRHPAQSAVEPGGVVLVLPGAHHHFSQIVHAGPDKIADEPGILLGHFPEAVGIVAEGLAAQNQAAGVLFQIVQIAVDAVVVAGDVHVGEGVPGFHVAAVKGGAPLHELVSQQARQIVEKLAAHRLVLFGFVPGGPGLLGGFQLLFGLFVAVYPHAQAAEEVKEDVHPAGHGTAVVQAVEVIGHLFGEGDALGLGRFAHLVAGGIEDHRGVVVVLFHHVLQILLPPVHEVVHIVVLGLVDVPVVDVLVHHQHAGAVADVQQSLGTGVVGRAEGVVARLAQQIHLALHGVGVADRPQQAVVVVDAGALQNHPAAVDKKALVPPFQGADAEGLAHLVGAEPHPADTQPGGFRAPKGGVGQVQFQGSGARAVQPVGGQHPAALQDLHFQLAGTAGVHLHPHPGGMDAQSPHPHPVAGDMGGLVPHPEGDGAVDARAGIPAAVGLVGVAGDDPDLVFLVEGKPVGELGVEVGVAVGALAELFPVQPHLGVVVDTLKLQNQPFVLQFAAGQKGFLVEIVKPFVPAGIGAAGSGFAFGLGQHGVVGDGHRQAGPLLLQMTAGPAAVERNGFHGVFPRFPLTKHGPRPG